MNAFSGGDEDPEEWKEKCALGASLVGANKSSVEEAADRIFLRLWKKGMYSIDTPGNGDCLFAAVIDTASLPITPQQLRKQACDYLERNARLFAAFSGGESGLREHIKIMRRDGTWATAFEVRQNKTLSPSTEPGCSMAGWWLVEK